MDGKRKILFIGVGFYDYDKSISDTLKDLGYDVTYACSVPPATAVRKFIKKAGLGFINRRYKKQFAFNTILSCPGGHDVVLVIKGENLTVETLEHLKKSNPGARFILYLWDNLKKIENRSFLLSRFDKIASFDRKDCLEYPELFFRPLFYLKREHPVEALKYDISFIGEDRPGRYGFLIKVSDALSGNLNVYLRLKSSILRVLIDRVMGRNICHNKQLPYREFCDIMQNSRSVLDVVEYNQSGLTMRTIEALAMGKHLFTTNAEIAASPHISPGTYTIIDRNCPVFDFTRYGRQEADFYEYYSLTYFIKDLLS